ncbi:hypothetical protein AMS68_002888 [Peltaster fructicola]|uniref:Uncharacterized protein n=1 Tax=Peltaster fructicola TaxID=286661 RepID=A0A6H0XRT8_9PEZI|nr:hypothetical protein AMS68_002888 [Peltaster fructicola]
MTKTAEQAKLCVASSSDGPNKQAVCDQVLTTARYIEDILQTAQAQNAVSHWTQTSLSIETWIEHISRHLAHGQDIVGNSSGASSFGGSLFGNNPLGLDSRDADIVPVHRYRARIVFDVCFQDFNILSQFKSHLTSVDHCVMLSGPDWNLPPHAEERLKSQLRMEAAQDASSKVADYCRVVCPGQDDIVIVPTELHSEHITGGSVPVPSKLDQPQGTLFSTGKPDRFLLKLLWVVARVVYYFLPYQDTRQI